MYSRFCHIGGSMMWIQVRLKPVEAVTAKVTWQQPGPASAVRKQQPAVLTISNHMSESQSNDLCDCMALLSLTCSCVASLTECYNMLCSPTNYFCGKTYVRLQFDVMITLGQYQWLH